MTRRPPRILDIAPLREPPAASVSLPGSKSITNRAIVCAALASGTTTLRGALFADDTEAMAGAVKVLGAGVDGDRAGGRLRIRGVDGRLSPQAPGVIDARMSGTTGRFLLPVAAMAHEPVTVDGDPQLRARPFGDLVAALRRLGASVEEPPGGESLPLRVSGPIRGREATVAAGRSSQFLSGLMLAGPLAPEGLTLHLDGPAVSRPYLDMTAAVMTSFGAAVEVGPDAVRVGGGGYRSPGSYRVEPDASSASYFWAAGAITGGSVGVEGIGAGSIQGDARFVSVLEAMGATVTVSGSGTAVAGGPLSGIDVDLADMSDTAVTLAVVASLAAGPTTVGGIGFIRHKESDRIAAVVAELRRCGVDARELADGFAVSPSGAPSGSLIRTYDDHRIAMAFSVLGLVVPGMRIENPGCVHKTFPRFHETLESLRGTPGPAAGPGGAGTIPSRSKEQDEAAPAAGPGGSGGPRSGGGSNR